VTLVANAWMRIPKNPRVTLEVVGDAFDVATTGDETFADATNNGLCRTSGNMQRRSKSSPTHHTHRKALP